MVEMGINWLRETGDRNQDDEDFLAGVRRRGDRVRRKNGEGRGDPEALVLLVLGRQRLSDEPPLEPLVHGRMPAHTRTVMFARRGDM